MNRDKLALAQLFFGPTEDGCCVKCKGEAKEFKDILSKRENEISGLCQECQDQFFEG